MYGVVVPPGLLLVLQERMNAGLAPVKEFLGGRAGVGVVQGRLQLHKMTAWNSDARARDWWIRRRGFLQAGV